MINSDTINDALRGLIRGLLEMPQGSVRPANQNAPVGTISEQYATVLLNNFAPTGQDDHTISDFDLPPDASATAVNQNTSGCRTFSASIQIFRGDAFSKTVRLSTLLQSAEARENLQNLGLGLVHISPALNLTALVDTNWEERGQLEVEFSCVSTEQSTLETYGTFDIETRTADQTLSIEVTSQ
jgi:hypothetical protein